MSIDWLSIVIGFISGVFASFVGTWIFHKLVTSKRSEEFSQSVTFSNESMQFQVDAKGNSEIEMYNVVKLLLEEAKEEKP